MLGGGDDARQPATAVPEAADATPTDAEGGATPPPASGDGRPRVVRAALPSAEGACEATDVTVTPTVDGSPRGGSDVALSLSVATAGDTACRLELTAEVLTLKVSTAGRSVWETEQCPGAVPERDLVLRPGWTTALVVTWPGIFSDKDCSGTTRDAPPGAYAVESAVYAGEPARFDFEVRPPQRPRGSQGQADQT
ncbi:MAG: hypothetical protein K0Q93_315 [Nocardioidaceae bacterium]|jgi:hypothetical protein|nr:hypothetical protein [Nocardioidaceae bacterium]